MLLSLTREQAAALIAAALIAGTPAPGLAAPSPRLLPANDKCVLDLGDFSSTLGPVHLSLYQTRDVQALMLTRDGLAGFGEGSHTEDLSGSLTQEISFSTRLSAGRLTLDARDPDRKLYELLATSPRITFGHRPSRILDAGILANDRMHRATPPRFTVTLGDISAQVIRMTQCATTLRIVERARFCVAVTVFQAQSDCPESAWRSPGGSDDQIDWVDTSRIRRAGDQVQFVVLTQHGSTADTAPHSIFTSTMRFVRGDCATRASMSTFVAEYDADGNSTSVAADRPTDPDDAMTTADLAAVCTDHWRLPIVAQPLEFSRNAFEQIRVKRDERRMFGRW